MHNRLKKISFIFIILLAQSLFAYQIVEFSAFPANNMIEISWKVQDGSQISKFVLERSVDDASWSNVYEIEYTGDHSDYIFQDYSVTKKGAMLTTNYFYRLKIHLKDGTVETSGSIMARPKYSGIYRTWGSLKALFR